MFSAAQRESLLIGVDSSMFQGLIPLQLPPILANRLDSDF